MASTELELPETAQRGFSRLTPTLLLLSTASVYLATTARNSLNLDVWSTNFATWLIATTGDPWMDPMNVPAVLDDSPIRGTWVMEAENGQSVIGRSPGPVAIALPAYWILRPTEMTTAPGAITAALVTAVSVLLVYLTIRRTAAAPYALPAAVVFGFTTPIWSVAADGMWPHTVTVLGIAGMAWAAAHDRWWLVGLFGGVALWGRLHVALTVALVGVLIALWRRRPDIVVKVGLPSAAMLVALMGWTRWIYGTWDPTASYSVTDYGGYVSENRFDLVNYLGFWISPGSGMLVWTPVIALLLPATVRHWRSQPDWSRALVWGGLLYTVVQLTLNRFSGGDTFYGYRLGLELLTCAAPALAIGAMRTGRGVQRALLPVIGVQLAVIYLGARFERFIVHADDVWTDSAFLLALTGNPVVAPLIVAAGLLITWLAFRIWKNPRLESLWGR